MRYVLWEFHRRYTMLRTARRCSHTNRTVGVQYRSNYSVSHSELSVLMVNFLVPLIKLRDLVVELLGLVIELSEKKNIKKLIKPNKIHELMKHGVAFSVGPGKCHTPAHARSSLSQAMTWAKVWMIVYPHGFISFSNPRGLTGKSATSNRVFSRTGAWIVKNKLISPLGCTGSGERRSWHRFQPMGTERRE